MQRSLWILILSIVLFRPIVALAAGSDDLQPKDQTDFWNGAQALAANWTQPGRDDGSRHDNDAGTKIDHEWARYLSERRNVSNWVCAAERDISETSLAGENSYALTCSLHTVLCRNTKGISWHAERFVVKLRIPAAVRAKAPVKLYRGDIVKFSGVLNGAEHTDAADCGFGIDADIGATTLELLRQFAD